MRSLSSASEPSLQADTARPLVDMQAITKAFGGVVACDAVDFQLRPGEVHALLGENGAGKSTLMKVLSGVLGDYHGTVAVNGRVQHLASPAAAHAAGISIIHQELDLVPDLSIAENLVLGKEPRTWWGAFDRLRAERVATEALARLDMTLNPRRRVGELRVGEQQLVAIAKSLSSNAQVLVMDEPTSALGQAETQHLFQVIDRLRTNGVGIVYISHYLEEVLALADRITVLRDGRGVGTVLPAHTSKRDIIGMMVGQPATSPSAAGERAPDAVSSEQDTDGPPLLTLANVRLQPRRPQTGRTEPAGVSLTVRPGEIVGLAGLLGSGRTELLETIFGAGSPGRLDGEVTWYGQGGPFSSPRSALARGVCFVPEDRKTAGLFFHHSVASNLAMAALTLVSRAGVIKKSGERSLARDLIRKLHIRTPNDTSPVGALSGGNQQKVVIGRQLLTQPKLLLLDDPTRGVDVGAKAEIYTVLRGLADDGLGVLFASSELPELVDACHRVVVLRQGQVVADWSTSGLTQEDILAAAQGEPNE